MFIPLNEVPGSQFTRSREEDMEEFVRRLEAKGISTTMRDTRHPADLSHGHTLDP
ncbi:hypothetical protein [Nocardioides sp. AE5]|uniref:hypothetical protein n=1 Tax=Nocardioides sp. AE5 TaxID=2962573 RepID=UPI002881AE96|nr:hypothetical protein [Nocardioides sp. AE5]MDT0201108.1 hypothetical protein [Nocardioides sp. AE5]